MTYFHRIMISWIFFAVLSMPVLAQEPNATITEVTTTTEGSPAPTGTVVERHTIVSPVPTAKEVIATPQGYVSCFTIDGAWVKDIWIPRHRVCQYEGSSEGVAWVEGYWQCNKSTPQGVCTNWEWKPGRWEKTLVVY